VYQDQKFSILYNILFYIQRDSFDDEFETGLYYAIVANSKRV